MVQEDTKAQRAIQSVEVGGRLLLALSHQAGPLTLKDLAALADLPPSRAHPYLVSFGRLGLVAQDPVSGHYALGPAALQLGLAALRQTDPLRAAGPVAEALARQTGQAVAVAVWGNLGPTVVRLQEALQPLHVALRAGSVMSVFGTATGRAFAAVLSADRIARATEWPGDPAPRSALEQEQASARRDYTRYGCTRAVGRPIPGVNAFSAPVFDHEGQCALVLTLLGHQDHVAPQWTSPMADAVRQAAAQISAQLGAP